MLFKALVTVSFILGLPLTSLAEDIGNCRYINTQVLKVNGGSGAACKENKLCFASINCEKGLAANGGVVVNRNIVCGLDAKTGRCPKVETCRNDTKTASFEAEAQVGKVSKTDWTSVAVNLAPMVLEAHVRSQAGMPLDGMEEKYSKEIDAIKSATEKNESVR